MTDNANANTWGDAALAVWSVLGDRPVAYHPELARALGDDVGAALFLAQLMYWSDKGTWEPGWIAKTQGEFYKETALTRYQQERVRKKLGANGLQVIMEKRKGVPARLWFRVRYDKLTELLMNHANGGEVPQCGKPAIKSAGKPQSEAEEPADKSAGKPQSISEISAQTTPETIPEKGAAKKAAPSVLDGIFVESAAVERSASVILEGDLDDLSDEERAQMATPTGADKPARTMDHKETIWHGFCRNITFPHSTTWREVYDHALLFSDLFGIPLPLTRNGVGQWRHGTVQGFVAFGEALQARDGLVWPAHVARRARWGLQVLHARRENEEAWTFDIVSPTSTANTLRVIAGDLQRMEELYGLTDRLPVEDEVREYYSTRPQSGGKRKSGSDVTASAVAELEAMGV